MQPSDNIPRWVSIDGVSRVFTNARVEYVQPVGNEATESSRMSELHRSTNINRAIGHEACFQLEANINADIKEGNLQRHTFEGTNFQSLGKQDANRVSNYQVVPQMNWD